MTLATQVLVLRLILIISLYLFLLAVVIVAWRELRSSASRLATRVEPQSTGGRKLVVVDAGETPLQTGDVFPLRPVTSLGRNLANAIVIPNSGASAEHALIAARDGHWWLEDLESTNGTFLNGVRVSEPAVIAPGDVIRVGHVQMKME